MSAPDIAALRSSIEALFDLAPDYYEDEHHALFQAFIDALNHGQVRAAEPDSGEPTGWRVNAWVKKGILLGFRMTTVVDMGIGGDGQRYLDKEAFPVRKIRVRDKIRVVPGGSAIRTGVYLGPGVTCMPPMYINVGAYVDEGTMVDSHALVGSCAQIGKRCHLSAAAQIGGVLEPVGAHPVIIEDDVMVGGNCGVYEGAVVKQGAVLGSGVILNRSTPIYDLPNERVIEAGEGSLVVPPGAVVVPGSRAIQRGVGKDWGLALATPIIVKYRDDKTSMRVQLEDLLR